ncbi:MAG TPA: hypothetical protein PK020_15685 [Ilumatobacteraceae bacterium]|nr:hypothetical protein [Ilumatobacteraceae bacterium]HRB04346.1 hypothetical protein [Ilumatobacteraceae bacterium]
MNRSISLIAGAVLAATLFVGCGDDAKSGTSTAAYCGKIAAYKAKSDELDVVFTGTPDADAVKTAFTTMQSMVHDLNKGAPAEIKTDVATMSGAIDNVVKIFSQYDWDFVKLASAPEFATLQSDLAGADMTAASDRLEKYSSETCGIAPDPTT